VQRVEPWNKDYQYLLFSAEPYEIISFKVCQGTVTGTSDLTDSEFLIGHLSTCTCTGWFTLFETPAKRVKADG